ncbi:MAG TPA: hypothetical protein VNF93_02425 [Buchnera sp. (in: enterobacteria)]|nr:hypothetical protein [Buchnera sp. (in: enterobacteria)]
MKPFDLEKALNGEPVITRNGYKVNQLKKYTVRCKKVIAGVIEDYNKINTWNIDGSFYRNQEDRRDLFMEDKPKKKYYLGIEKFSPDKKYRLTSYLCECKEQVINGEWDKIIEIEMD